MGLPDKQHNQVDQDKGQSVSPDFFGDPEAAEDLLILNLVKRSAWILLTITTFFMADYSLPDDSLADEPIEFVHAGNRLEKVITRNNSFRPHQAHKHSTYFTQGPLILNSRPITGFVSTYQFSEEKDAPKFRPEFCQDSYISLIYIAFALSLVQLFLKISLFYRMAVWIFSLGSTVGYFVMMLAFS